MDFDFGYNAGETGTDTSAANGNGDSNATNIDDGKQHSTGADANATNLDDANKGDNNSSNDGTGNNSTDSNANAGDSNSGNSDDNSENNEDANKDNKLYEAGTELDVDGVKYIVAENGDILDAENNVFKKADEVQEWVDSFDDNNSSDEVSIEAIQNLIGIEITDDDNNLIEFENSPKGVQEYLNSIIQTERENAAEATINALYSKYPVIEHVLNYYVANGNSLEGFGEVPDRTNIEVDDTNENQQEYIIRTAWKEQNRKGEVDGYIQYLKANNLLLDTAKEELEGIKERDRELQDELAREAEEREASAIEAQKKYWDGVREVINNKTIGEYKIPDTIIITKDGKKTSATPKDFYNYIYQTDKNGKSAYENDLAKESPTQRLNDELLAAYLKFSGGNYAGLVNMAVHENNVKTIKLRSAKRPTSKVKVTPAANNANKDVDLGYN